MSGLRRSARVANRIDYAVFNEDGAKEEKMDELTIHADDAGLFNFEEEDSKVLESMLESEAAENAALEAKFQQLKADDTRRRKQMILDSLQKLQAIKERNALLKRAMAGEVPVSAVKAPAPASTPLNSPTSLNPESGAAPVVSGPSIAPTSEQHKPSGEYLDLVNSILHLKSGNSAPFAELMNNPSLLKSEGRSGSLPNLASRVGSEHVKESGARKNLKFDLKPTVRDDLPVNTPNCVDNSNGNYMHSHLKQESVSECKLRNSDKVSLKHKKACECDDSDSDSDHDKKIKKRKSGILTKPDESDIVKTVKFPHELLDDRHVKNSDKSFDRLSFPLFCAGELELIRRGGIQDVEKDARIDILMTLCYHSTYLSPDELKSQYRATLQRIERGAAKWGNDLAERLHTDLAFRASVLARKNESKSDKTDNKPSVNKSSKGDTAKTDHKFHYCADFNKGNCSFKDNHEGKLSGKDVTLWHICKRCLFSTEKLVRMHPESDPECPSRR